jgi:23S rRNA pseudouridine2605 synthase
MRLQKFLSEAGVASRRASEMIIREGRVTVNGRVVTEMGTQIEPTDRITVDGRQVKTRKKIYIALNKPEGYISTRKDPEGRRTLHELLPPEWLNLYSVGRLDFASQGLIFLTNDGDFCLKMTHPRYGMIKHYEVTVEGRVDPEVLDNLVKGVIDKGERLRVQKARLLHASNSRSILEVELKEGKYREIRRLFQILGYSVERLVRTKIGPIRLGELPVGKWRTLSEAELKSLKSKI